MDLQDFINQLKSQLKDEVKAELKAEFRRQPRTNGYNGHKKYRRWNPEEKEKILREAQSARDTNAWGAVRLVCKRYGITSTHLHNWTKRNKT